MIKGIYLETEPNMSKVSDKEVLENLDLLKTISDPDTFNINDNKFERTLYYSDKYYIVVYKFVGKDINYYKDGWKPYELLQKAYPDLITAFKYGDNKIIYAYPRYNTREDTVYRLLIEELIRFISFFYYTMQSGKKDSESSEMTDYITVEYIKSYINFSVSTPNKRNNGK